MLHVFVKLVLMLGRQCVSCIRRHLFVAHQCLVNRPGLASFAGYFLSRGVFALGIVFFIFDTTYAFSLFLAIVPAAVDQLLLFLSHVLRFFPGPRSPLVLLHVNYAIWSLKICWFVFRSPTPVVCSFQLAISFLFQIFESAFLVFSQFGFVVFDPVWIVMPARGTEISLFLLNVSLVPSGVTEEQRLGHPLQAIDR